MSYLEFFILDAAWSFAVDAVVWIAQHFAGGMIAAGGLLFGVSLAHQVLVRSVAGVAERLDAEHQPEAGSPCPASVPAPALATAFFDPDFDDEPISPDWP
jgi:hypothetical protein